jgi:6-phosphogluconolactonase (cycloisomerase 2 family)
LYAANQNSDTIVHFRIERASGRLTPTGDVTAIGGPVCILFS